MVIQYRSARALHNENDQEMKQQNAEQPAIKDINDLLLSPQRLRKMTALFMGTYFRSPASPSIMNGVLSYLSSSKSKPSKQIGFKSQIFMVLAKRNRHSDRYTHLKWAKSRAHIHSDAAQSVAISHIESIEIYKSKASDQADKDCLFYVKITWNPSLDLQPLIVHHNWTNYAYQWAFVSALKSVCDAGGVSVKQWNQAMNPKENGINGMNGMSEDRLADRHFDDTTEPKPISVFCCTFNVAVGSPDEALAMWLKPKLNGNVHWKADLFAITLQEVVDLASTDMLLQRHCEFEWEDAIGKVLGESVVKIESVVRGGLVLFLFARKRVIPEMRHIAFGGLNVGAMGAPNKSGVAIRVQMRGHRLCFIGAHLPSGKGSNALRNDSFHRIYGDLKFDGDAQRNKYGRIGDHDAIFWCGDLNYRLSINNTQIATVFDLIRRKRVEKLLKYDQLKKGQQRREAFSRFIEPEIAFLPTYKFEPGTSRYETRKQKPLRMPSYTDRILYHLNRKRVRIESLAYDSVIDVMISDHKPVYALFKIHREMEERSISLSNNGVDTDRIGIVDVEAPLDLHRYFLQIEFLQKNYNFHYSEAVKGLKGDIDRNKAFLNFEASHQDLVKQMDTLMRAMKSQFIGSGMTEREQQSNDDEDDDDDDDELTRTRSNGVNHLVEKNGQKMNEPPTESALNGQRSATTTTEGNHDDDDQEQRNGVMIHDMLHLGDHEEDDLEEDDDGIDDIASLVVGISSSGTDDIE